jgi:hypothetical protein
VAADGRARLFPNFIIPCEKANSRALADVHEMRVNSVMVVMLIRIKILLSFSTVYNSGTLRAAYVAELEVFFWPSFGGVVWTELNECGY